jgi:hypothetical protein
MVNNLKNIGLRPGIRWVVFNEKNNTLGRFKRLFCFR